MSKTIDERVVSMQFDNSKFEKNVATTMSTLDKLKDKLSFKGASKGLEDVNTAAKRVDMSGLGRTVEAVGTKFSALQVMGVTALANITNSAVNTGKRIVSALTIDPIKTGFSEYETKMNAIQTIMSNTASKGTTMDDVTRVIGELNTYADKTIYNFAEMTRNIGTFTAAGVGLEEAATAIQGIANLAAASGSSSQQASTAMYQLSQALSTGTVRLMDWNSVVNAGMGGEKFQEALKATAREYGVNVDEMIDRNGSFRDSLQDGWLSADILNTTLQKFTVEGAKEYGEAMVESGKWTQEEVDALIVMAQEMEDAATKVKTFTQLWDTLKESAQSGWSQTWELIIGDFEEAKTVLTKFSDVIGGMIGASADARNELISGGLRSGWDQLLGEGINDEAGYAEVIKSVAKERGIAIDEMIDKSGSFEASLKEGWLTSDMLSESITKFGDKLRGMSDAELEAAGYTKEHVQEITALEDAVKNGSISLEDFAKKIERPSGRENLIDAIWNTFNGLLSIITPIKEAFQDIFPPATAEQLYAFTAGLKEITAKLTISETTSNNLKRTFKGLFAILDIGKQAFSAIFNIIKPLFGKIGDLSGGLLGMTASWGDWLVQLSENIKKTNVFEKALGKVVDIIKIVIDAVKNFINAVKVKIVIPGLDLLGALLERIGKRMSSVKDASDTMRNGVVDSIEAMGSSLANSDFIKMFQSLWNGVKTIGSGLAKAFGALTEGLVDKIANADYNGIFDFINTLSLSTITVFIGKFVKGFSDIVETGKGIKDSVVDILDSVKGCFEAYQTQLKAGALLKIASAIAILTVSVLILSLIDSEKLSASLGAIITLFASLMTAMAIFSKISGDIKGVFKTTTAMIGISIAVLILASALKKLSGMKPGEMVIGLIGILGLTAIVIAAAKMLATGGKKIIKGAVQMVIFAAAIKILASVCKDLSSLSWVELAKGLVGVGVLLTSVSLFLRTAKFSGKTILTATGIVILSAAIKILASVCKTFAQMKWSDIGKGLAAIGGLLLEVALFTRLTGNAKHVISSGIALIAIGAAMKIFASVASTLAKLSWEEIGKGLAVIAGSLLAVTLAVNFMPKNMIGKGLGLIAISTALVILANVMGKISEMSWEGIAKGLVAIGGSMLILALGLHAMNGTIGGSASLIIAAAALLVLTPVLVTLGNMRWENIAKGLITIAGAFVVIGVAGLILGPLVGTILGLAGAFALIGVGVVAIGAGLLIAGVGLSALSVGFSALATSLAGGATAIVAALTVIIVGVVSLIPTIMEKIGEGIIVLCEVLAEGAPAIAKAIKAIVLNLIDILVECVPAIANGLLALLSAVLDALVTYTPKIVDSIFSFLIALLNGIADKMPELIQAAFNIVMSFFAGVIDAISGIDVEVLIKGLAGIGLMAGIMAALSAVAALVPGAMVGILGIGAVIAELVLVIAAVGLLAQLPGLEWLINEGGNLLEGLGTAIGKFVGGIVGGVLRGITSSLPQIGTDLSAFITNATPFIEGVKMVDASVLAGVGVLAGCVLALTAADLIAGIASFVQGGSSFASLGTELSAFMVNAMPFITGATALNADMINGVKALAETILILTAANVLEGLASWFGGESSLETFGQQLGPLGTYLNEFATNLGTFGEDQITTVTCAAKAIKLMSEAADQIPNSGGWLGKIVGENDIGAFGAQLPALGSYLSLFATNLGTFGEDQIATVDCAARAIKQISDAAAGIPNEGGWLAKIVGDNNIATFASKLPGLGTNLSAFATNLGTFGEDKISTVDCAARAISAIATAAESIPNEGGWLAKLVGDNDIETFGKKLPSLGTNLKGFAYGVGSFDERHINSVNAAVKAIAAFSSLANCDLKSAQKNIGDFGDELPGLGKDIASFASEMSKVNASSVTSASTNLKTLANAIKNLEGVDKKAASNFSDAIKTLGKTALDAFVKTFTSEASKTSIKTATSDLMTKAKEGFESKLETLKKAVSTIVSSVASSIKSKTNYTTFYNAGSYLVDGFADGISENDYKAAAKAKAMAKAAAQAAEDELGIQSPSKVGYGIGDFFGLGFVNAIKDYAGISYTTSRDMAKSAHSGLSDAMDSATDAFNDALSSQPTIRPVIDLSAVRTGADAIGDMLDMGTSIGVLSRVGAINAAISQRTQNGDNSDVVSELKKLGKKLDNVGSTTNNFGDFTYDDGSNITEAVKTLTRAAKMERRV